MHTLSVDEINRRVEDRMQTILGATGQIAIELARELRLSHTRDLRLVSRNPRKVDDADTLARADLLDASQTSAAVEGSEIVYFTAGLPADTSLWEAQFPTMLRNALDAARTVGAKFAYFDNTYMYPQDGRVQTEDTPFAPVGRKGRVRAAMAQMVLDEMARGDIPVLIARAPEFYGPGRTQSFTNSLIIDNLLAGKKARVPVRADRLRTLVWTPDASRGLATLGNTPDAFGQTWHLPVDADRLTYRQFIELAAEVLGVDADYSVIPKWLLSAAGTFSPQAREIRELLTRYRHDNVFDATKFAVRFPDFPVTTYRRGLEIIRDEARGASDGR
jgi:nucleoside-diphosphate-sugar epimerase